MTDALRAAREAYARRDRSAAREEAPPARSDDATFEVLEVGKLDACECFDLITAFDTTGG